MPLWNRKLEFVINIDTKKPDKEIHKFKQRAEKTLNSINLGVLDKNINSLKSNLYSLNKELSNTSVISRKWFVDKSSVTATKKSIDKIQRNIKTTWESIKNNLKVKAQIDTKDLYTELNKIKTKSFGTARDTWKAIDSIDFSKAENSAIDLQIELEKLKVLQRKLKKAEWLDWEWYRKAKIAVASVSDELREAKRHLLNLKNTWDKTTTRLQKKFDWVWKSIKWAFWWLKSSFLWLAAGWGFLWWLAKSTQVAIDFDLNMARVKATTWATTEAFDKLKNKALEVWKSTTFSASQAAEWLNFLAMAWFNAQDSMDALNWTVKLAEIWQIWLGEAADIASNIMSQFKIPARDTERVIDILAKTVTSSNTNITQMAEAMKFAWPTFAGMNISIEETAATIWILWDNWLQWSIATQALATWIVRLAKPSKEAAKEIAKMWLEAFDSSEQFVWMVDLIEQLQEKTENYTDKERLAAFSRIFGSDSLKQINALYSTWSEKLRTLTQSLENSNGESEKMAKIIRDSLSWQIKTLKSKWEDIWIMIWTYLVPKLIELADFLTWIATKFKEWAEENPKTVKSIELISLAIWWLILIWWTLWIALWTIAFGLKWVTKAFYIARTAILLARTALLLLSWPIWWAVLAIWWLAKAYQSNLWWFATFVDTLWNKANELLHWMINKHIEWLNYLVRKSNELFWTSFEEFEQFWYNIMEWLESWVKSWKQSYLDTLLTVNSDWDKILSDNSWSEEAWANKINSYANWLALMRDNPLDIIRWIKTEWEEIFASNSNTEQSWSNFTLWFWAWILWWQYKVINSSKEVINSAKIQFKNTDWIKESWKKIPETYATWIKSSESTVSSASKQIASIPKHELEKNQANAKSWWSKLIGIYAKWLSSASPIVRDALWWIASIAKATLKPWSPTEEWPLSEYQDVWWYHLIEEIASWVDKAQPLVRKSVYKIAEELKELKWLSMDFKTKDSVDKELSKNNKALQTLVFGTEWFNETQRQIKLLEQLRTRYNWNLTNQEKELAKIKKDLEKENIKRWKDWLKRVDKEIKRIEKLEKTTKKTYATEQKEVEDWTRLLAEHAKQLDAVADKLEDMREKSIDSIQNINNELDNLGLDTEKKLAKRKIWIEKQLQELLKKWIDWTAWAWISNAQLESWDFNDSDFGGFWWAELLEARKLQEELRLINENSSKLIQDQVADYEKLNESEKLLFNAQEKRFNLNEEMLLENAIADELDIIVKKDDKDWIEVFVANEEWELIKLENFKLAQKARDLLENRNLLQEKHRELTNTLALDLEAVAWNYSDLKDLESLHTEFLAEEIAKRIWLQSEYQESLRDSIELMKESWFVMPKASNDPDNNSNWNITTITNNITNNNNSASAVERNTQLQQWLFWISNNR